MVYSQLVFINEGSAEVLVIFVQDFYLLNLSKTLGELGQQIEMHLDLLAKFTKCFKQVQKVKVLNKGQDITSSVAQSALTCLSDLCQPKALNPSSPRLLQDYPDITLVYDDEPVQSTAASRIPGYLPCLRRQ